jgi:putative ABC transport system permease protein
VTPSRLVRIARQRFRTIARPKDLESEIAREMAIHLDQLTREKQADGLSHEAARRVARREFGNLAVLVERSRDELGLTWVSDMRQDAGHGWRVLRRSPGFTTIAVLSLALGIGASAAVACAIAFALARPLPFPQADRIVTIQRYPADSPTQRGGSSMYEYRIWRDRTRTLEQVGGSISSPRLIAADAPVGPAERVAGQAFTPGLFAALGVQPGAGHLFEETNKPFSKAALVVVISNRLWQRRFAGADIIGRQMIVDGASRQIVGIMGPGFRYQDDNVDLWTPLIVSREPATARPSDARVVLVTARLKANVTMTEAQADLDDMAASIASASQGSRPGWVVRLVPLRQALYGWTRPRLFTLAVCVGLVLVLACANVAGLLLARGSTRRREVAMRMALGATRGRIVRQLLTESLVLGLLAGMLGMLIAWAGLSAVTAALGPPPGLPRLGGMRVDGWVCGAVLLLAVASSLGFGLVPALTEGTRSPGGTLNGSASAASRPPKDGRVRGALVSAQVALAEVLLIGTALLSLSFIRLTGRELNFDPRGLLTFEYGIPAPQFARPLETSEGLPFFEVSALGSQTIQRVHERLRTVSGVESVAGISYPPVNSLILPAMAVRPLERSAGAPSRDPVAAYFLVTPNLFATLRTPIVRGREFDDRDVMTAPWTVVVNGAMARLCWPGEDPIGKHLRIDAGPDERVREVIGLVGDVPTRLDQVDPQPAIYAAYLQQPSRYRGRAVGMFGGMTFAIRHTGDSTDVLANARRAVAEVTPDRPIAAVGTVEAHLSARLLERRNYVAAILAFAMTAALLAVVGIYGVTGYAVNARMGEIAVRKALGARPYDLVKLIGRPALMLVGGGLAAGLAASLAFTRLLAPQLWGITATDPATFVGVSLGLASAALLGCVGPLRRGLSIDPAVRLRSE